ncbi:MAG: type IV secretion system DNA-binding domain-containing protein [Candidatus Sungbacteria bacterium]|uniref:Type IV secretion system DNA-binding domain-containing protein n=1 Tax=Candidatus Sungiibacteriota bacterium TaxID=2750080 RepID=A0A932DS45_9BACT|nr:type IV secretion system DNA-binding domain-containing protein [Candidatus Sungbacteria bacterium]
MNNEINNVTLFAETNFRNEKRKFGIKEDDRRRHMYIIGKTGMGKTTMLENMIISDIIHGKGVGFIDPHGDSADKILDFVPPERVKDVIYFDPSDLDRPIAFNAIENVEPEKKHLVASGLMGVFKKIWPDVWSARMEYILNNTILALLDYPGATVLGIMRMLSNKDYRKEVVDQIKDPVVKSFWVDEFAKYTDRFAAEATPAIQNKVGQFLSAAVIRNIVGQVKSAIDMRTVMDQGKILIMNLSKGRIGEDNSKLLGGLLVTKLQLAAMSRVDIPEAERRDFYLYVDEFQNFATESFANILSEARKYRLALVLANQYVAQLIQSVGGSRSTAVRDAIFGNVGTIISFRVGAEDAEFLEKEFAPEFTAVDVVNLAKYNVYLKLMIDGVASRAFSATTLAPYPRPETSYREDIIKYSRETYGTPREEVEAEIADWAGVSELMPTKIKERRLENTAGFRPAVSADSVAVSEPRPNRFSAAAVSPPRPEAAGKPFGAVPGKQMYEAVCWEGGEKVWVPFKPDGVRPIYCKDHLYKLNEVKQKLISDHYKPTSLQEALEKGDIVNNLGGEARPQRKKNKPKGPPADLEGLRSLLSDIKPTN